MKIIGLLLFVATLNFPLSAKTFLYKNINGYTLNQSGELIKFSAMKFTDNKVDKLYSSLDTLPNENINIIDGEGKTLLPGLIDAHGHVLSYGLSLIQVDLNGVTSEQAAVERAIAFKKQNKVGQWLLGRGWNQVLWQGKKFPQAISLDEYFKDIPIWFKRVDGHAGWANSKAMELAGIDKTSISPAGGEIIKDQHGNPTGIFIDNAMALITDKIPQISPKEMEQALLKSMKALAKVGLTSVHDAGISNENISAYKSLAQQNKMPIRVNAMIDINDQNINKLLQAGHFSSQDQMLTINSVKISADGALGSRGASLIHDYTDLPNHKGLMLYDNETLEKLVTMAMSYGFQVNTHAIGDNANTAVLDIYEKHLTSPELKAKRHRIEHAQVLQLADIPRFAELSIIASMQATHATSDKNMAQDRLGDTRILGAYAWQKLLQAGAVIAGGSDFPIESANPFFGLHASITRQDKKNMPNKGWYINEAMTTTQAFRSFTLDAAYSAHQENMIGSLAKNKKADFILIDQDIFNVKPSEIWKTQVVETWVNGKQVDVD